MAISLKSLFITNSSLIRNDLNVDCLAAFLKLNLASLHLRLPPACWWLFLGRLLRFLLDYDDFRATYLLEFWIHTLVLYLTSDAVSSSWLQLALNRFIVFHDQKLRIVVDHSTLRRPRWWHSLCYLFLLDLEVALGQWIGLLIVLKQFLTFLIG